MIKIGILGTAGYTGSELIRLLVNHPQAEIVFANSESHAGCKVSEVHEGLVGDTDLTFTDQMPFDEVDVLFFCFGHGKSAQFLSEHTIPEHVRIIDLAMDFRISGDHDYVYGLPELNREAIRQARHVANPGCYATCIQLALLPLAAKGLLTKDVVVNAMTGSTGAGQKTTFSTHFSWRSNNLSIYRALEHQHMPEIYQSLNQLQGTPVLGNGEGEVAIDFIPWRGDFARGIFATIVVPFAEPCDFAALYQEYYDNEPFTHYCPQPIDLKQVVNTNKCLVHTEVHGQKLLVTACIDNLLKGAVGQAVQNMNLLFGLDECIGLKLKASAF